MEALLRSEPGAPLTVKQQVVAGGGAGIAVSFLACPTELIKCRSVEPGQFLHRSVRLNGECLDGPVLHVNFYFS